MMDESSLQNVTTPQQTAAALKANNYNPVA
jgi:hypothetical protein